MTPGSAPSEPSRYRYDVFISYRTSDRPWVKGELMRRLEANGLRVCIDYRDFTPGRATLENIERAAEESHRTLLVFTPAYLESEWTHFEQLLLQTDDPANKNLRFIPLMKERCKLPKRLSPFTYVDFVTPEEPDLPWKQLLTALGKPPDAEPPEEPTPRDWLLAHPYAMPPHFTGRIAERQRLSQWLNADQEHPLFIVRALGGFGKSALTWHWLLYDVEPQRWRKVVWWSFYESQASFENFLTVTLAYLSNRNPQDLTPRQQLEELLDYLKRSNILLVLDGFERELRAYSSLGAAYQGDEMSSAQLPNGDFTGQDCISPLADLFLRTLASLPFIQSKVLMTTRLRPRSVEVYGGDLLQGCEEMELTQMHPDDAVAYFQNRGVRGSRGEIQQACAAYGYHPLSLRLLAGLVLNDPESPGDIAVAPQLAGEVTPIQRQHHVLEQSYRNLSVSGRRLLSRMACFRSPVDYSTLKAVAGTESDVGGAGHDGAGHGGAGHGSAMSLREDLRDLMGRGLLQHDRRHNLYDLHPIVRSYAYDRMGNEERTTAHAQLRDYFAAVPQPERVKTIDDLTPVIELYHHMVRAGQYDEAEQLFRDRLHDILYYQLGAYQRYSELLRALFPHGEDHPPQLTDEYLQGWICNSLGNSYSLSGQPTRAVPLFEKYVGVCEKLEDKKNLAIALSNLAAYGQLPTGTLYNAETNLRRSIALCQEIEDEFWEAYGHQELGRLLVYRGAWAESDEELQLAENYWERNDNAEWLGKNDNHRAFRLLLLNRFNKGQILRISYHALETAQRSLELAEEWARTRYPLERDFVRAFWLLGAAHRVNGNLIESDTHLNTALTRCRTINLADSEANILLDLARLRADQGQSDEALRLADEALLITERSGYVLQGADVHLFLAEQALGRGDESAARHHARVARELATCDGAPDYTYKVAYDEAGALLTRLG